MYFKNLLAFNFLIRCYCYYNNYMLNSHKCISLIYVRESSLGKLPFLISVHLKTSALFEVSHFLSAEVSPKIMVMVKINRGFRT